jgi:ABC-type cobalamin/Fe3+-siderophores transport system ATPase subunit
VGFGRNGAGKTALKCLVGLLPVNATTIHIDFIADPKYSVGAAIGKKYLAPVA